MLLSCQKISVQFFKTYLRRDWAALAIFCLAAVWSIYPIWQAPHRYLIGWPGDNIQYAYMTGQMAEALFKGQNPFVDTQLNYPDQLGLLTSETPFWGILLLAPLTQLTNPVLGYNAILFLCGLLSGYFCYLWITRLTGSRFGGIIAGLAFLLLPYRIVHSYGHPNLISTQFMPLFFWGLDVSLQSAAPARRNIVFLAASLFLIGASSQYYLAMCSSGSLLYLLLARPNLKYWLHQGWKILVGIAVGAFLGVLPYLFETREAAYQPYNPVETRVWSASLLDFFAPSRLHPLWGAWIENAYPRPTWIEHTLYLGVVCLVLAGVALIGKRNLLKNRTWVWGGVILFGLLIALGTDLHWNGQPLQAENPFWLPAYYLQFFPGINLMRVWSRFVILPMLFIALLAGIGASWLQQRSRHPKLVMLVCTGLLLLDFAPGRIEATYWTPREVDFWLAAQADQQAAIFLPIGVDNYAAMYGSLFHNHPLPVYNHPQHLPPAYRQIAAAMQTFPAPETIQTLRDLHYRYIILSKVFFDGTRAPALETVQAALEKNSDLAQKADLSEYVIYSFSSP